MKYETEVVMKNQHIKIILVSLGVSNTAICLAEDLNSSEPEYLPKIILEGQILRPGTVGILPNQGGINKG